MRENLEILPLGVKLRIREDGVTYCATTISQFSLTKDTVLLKTVFGTCYETFFVSVMASNIKFNVRQSSITNLFDLRKWVMLLQIMSGLGLKIGAVWQPYRSVLLGGV